MSKYLKHRWTGHSMKEDEDSEFTIKLLRARLENDKYINGEAIKKASDEKIRELYKLMYNDGGLEFIEQLMMTVDS